jgi:hypothetical protein
MKLALKLGHIGSTHNMSVCGVETKEKFTRQRRINSGMV